MFLEKLTDYYGLPGEVEAAFIAERLKAYTADDEVKLYEEVLKTRTKRFGFPDIAFLTKLFDKVPPADKVSGKIAWWKICDNCKCEYHKDLMECPRCWRNGYSCRSMKVIKGYSVADTVVKYNKTYTLSTKDDPSCYDCAHGGTNYCPDFGRSKFDCKKRHECLCNTCCMRAAAEEKRGYYKVNDVVVKPRTAC